MLATNIKLRLPLASILLCAVFLAASQGVSAQPKNPTLAWLVDHPEFALSSPRIAGLIEGAATATVSILRCPPAAQQALLSPPDTVAALVAWSKGLGAIHLTPHWYPFGTFETFVSEAITLMAVEQLRCKLVAP